MNRMKKAAPPPKILCIVFILSKNRRCRAGTASQALTHGKLRSRAVRHAGFTYLAALFNLAVMHDKISPAPWLLSGEGYMIFYRFSRQFVERHCPLPPELAGRFDGFFGSVMLVNYAESPVGPYRELLFMPGKFRTPQGRRYSITHIAVDSEASTLSGRANWGIPKLTRQFRAEREGHTERIQALAPDGQPYFDIQLRSGGLHFPISTALIPIRLWQTEQGKTFLTDPKGSGTGQLARVLDVKVNPDLFPDICRARPLLALRVTDFRMCFPESRVL